MFLFIVVGAAILKLLTSVIVIARFIRDKVTNAATAHADLKPELTRAPWN